MQMVQQTDSIHPSPEYPNIWQNTFKNLVLGPKTNNFPNACSQTLPEFLWLKCGLQKA